jgi:elongation factor 2
LFARSLGGRAFPQTVFSHWSVMPGDVMEEDSLPYNTVMQVRARKGLKLAFPLLQDYHDKL